MTYKRYKSVVQHVPTFEIRVKGKVFTEPHTSKDKWYLRIILDSTSASFIEEFEKRYEKHANVSLQQTLSSTNLIILKLPFRYKRFECKVFDRDGDPLTCYDIKEGMNVDIKTVHAGFSYQDINILSTWKVKELTITE